jgi:hypothetical protein
MNNNGTKEQRFAANPAENRRVTRHPSPVTIPTMIPVRKPAVSGDISENFRGRLVHNVIRRMNFR